MKRYVLLVLSTIAWFYVCALPPEIDTFKIEIKRLSNVGDSLITGQLIVNGELIGKTYENADSLVKAGIYKGLMRYYSPSGFASGPFGSIGKKGDFLLEVERALSTTNRVKENVLFHTGYLPKHSKGCILLGPPSGPKGARYIPDEHALRKLRLKFYGKEEPVSSPNVYITINLTENF